MRLVRAGQGGLSTAFCPTGQGLGHGLSYIVTTTTTPTGQEDTGQGRLRRPSLQVPRAPALFFSPTQIIYAPERPSKRWQSACIPNDPNDTRSVIGNNGPIIIFYYLPNLGMVCRPRPWHAMPDRLRVPPGRSGTSGKGWRGKAALCNGSGPAMSGSAASESSVHGDRARPGPARPISGDRTGRRRASIAAPAGLDGARRATGGPSLSQKRWGGITREERRLRLKVGGGGGGGV